MCCVLCILAGALVASILILLCVGAAAERRTSENQSMEDAFRRAQKRLEEEARANEELEKVIWKRKP